MEIIRNYPGLTQEDYRPPVSLMRDDALAAERVYPIGGSSKVRFLSRREHAWGLG